MTLELKKIPSICLDSQLSSVKCRALKNVDYCSRFSMSTLPEVVRAGVHATPETVQPLTDALDGVTNAVGDLAFSTISLEDRAVLKMLIPVLQSGL